MFPSNALCRRTNSMGPKCWTEFRWLTYPDFTVKISNFTVNSKLLQPAGTKTTLSTNPLDRLPHIHTSLHSQRVYLSTGTPRGNASWQRTLFITRGRWWRTNPSIGQPSTIQYTYYTKIIHLRVHHRAGTGRQIVRFSFGKKSTIPALGGEI